MVRTDDVHPLGVIILTVSGGYRSHQMGLFECFPVSRHVRGDCDQGKVMRPAESRGGSLLKFSGGVVPTRETTLLDQWLSFPNLPLTSLKGERRSHEQWSRTVSLRSE